MHPVLFSIGSFNFPAYGFFCAMAYLVGILYILKTTPEDKDKMSDILFYTILSGLLGAKLFYVLTYWDSFGTDFLMKLKNVFLTFRYGFVFYGGFVGGVIGFFITSRIKKIKPSAILDSMIPAVPLAHAIGRIGCFCAGCCYGAPTASVFGVRFTSTLSEVPPQLLGVPLHPVQLYESFGNLIIFAVLSVLYSKRKQLKLPVNSLVWLYAVLYSLLRFSLEFIRGDDRGGFFLSMSPAQNVSVIIIITALCLIPVIFNKKYENK